MMRPSKTTKYLKCLTQLEYYFALDASAQNTTYETLDFTKVYFCLRCIHLREKKSSNVVDVTKTSPSKTCTTKHNEGKYYDHYSQSIETRHVMSTQHLTSYINMTSKNNICS
ncbi:unnamed protein product [Musa hybrid cultivar]